MLSPFALLITILFCINFQASDALTAEEGAEIKEHLGKLFKSSRLDRKHNIWLPAKILRLAFHDAATFRSETEDNVASGGSHAVMREKCVSVHYADCEQDDKDNKGLEIARDAMERVYQKFEGAISHADLWQLAANVAVEHARGPQLAFSWGRNDLGEEYGITGRLPAASLDFEGLRAHLGDAAFGLSDEEIVACQGAHSIGFLHKKTSGHSGQWDGTPTNFDQAYFDGLKRVKTQLWPKQSNGDFKLILSRHIMLPSDAACFDELPNIVKKFSDDKQAFFRAFASGWEKIQNAGHDNLEYIELPPLSSGSITRKVRIPNFFGSPEGIRFSIPKIGFPQLKLPKINLPKIRIGHHIKKVGHHISNFHKHIQRVGKFRFFGRAEEGQATDEELTDEELTDEEVLANSSNDDETMPGYAIGLFVSLSIVSVLLIGVLVLLTIKIRRA